MVLVSVLVSDLIKKSLNNFEIFCIDISIVFIFLVALHP